MLKMFKKEAILHKSLKIDFRDLADAIPDFNLERLCIKVNDFNGNKYASFPDWNSLNRPNLIHHEPKIAKYQC